MLQRLALVLRAWLAPAALALASCGGGGGGGGSSPPPPPPSSDASLSSLQISAGTLTPAFDPATTDYACSVPLLAAGVMLTATTTEAGATLAIQSTAATSGVATDPIAVPTGASTLTVQVTAPDGTTTRTYTIAMDRAGSLAAGTYLKAGSATINDLFGQAVAISGETLVVGGTAGAGAAHVFVRNGAGWAHQATLGASNAGAGDAFGCAVAISGDTIVVGARLEDSASSSVSGTLPADDNSASAAGAAYVFVRSGTAWSQQAYLKAPNPDADDQFGTAVSISGDTVVVGAPFEDSASTTVTSGPAVVDDDTAPNAGAAYVFVRSASTWAHQACLKPSNTDAGDLFGTAVAVSGDTVVAGAPEEASNATTIDGNASDDSSPGTGAAYVFLRTGTSWAQQAYLKAPNAGQGDTFGRAVALSGSTAVVGAPYESSNSTTVSSGPTVVDNNLALAAGAAYVFVRSGSNWSHQACLKASNAEADDQFGTAVSIDAHTICVGAPFEDSAGIGPNSNQADNSAADAGAAYVFLRTGTTWGPWLYLKPSNTGAGDQGGSALALAGGLLAVGAPREDSNDTGVGGLGADNSVSGAGAAYAVR